jgi:hypothetical protein
MPNPKFTLIVLAVVGAFGLSTSAEAAYVIAIDTDGSSTNGAVTYNPNFSFGGDTSTASASAASTAVGLPVGNSIFGGNGSGSPDTYRFTYSPGTDGDNLTLAAGTALNANGNVASGEAAGGSGTYNIYATWPATTNVSGGLTTFTLFEGANSLFSVQVNQNTAVGNAGNGNQWVFLGSADLDAGLTYDLVQTAGSNTFVSMRSSGVLFDAQVSAVPEPGTCGALVAVGLCAAYRRRRARPA